MSSTPDRRTSPYRFQIFRESEKNSSSNCMIHIWVENQTGQNRGSGWARISFRNF